MAYFSGTESQGGKRQFAVFINDDGAVRGLFEEIPGEAEEPDEKENSGSCQKIFPYWLTHTFPFAVLDL